MSTMRILLGGMLALTLVGCAGSPDAHYPPEVKAAIARRDRIVDVGAVRARYDDYMRTSPVKSKANYDDEARATRTRHIVAHVMGMSADTSDVVAHSCPLDEDTYACMDRKYRLTCTLQSTALKDVGGQYSEFPHWHLVTIPKSEWDMLDKVHYKDGTTALQRVYVKHCRANTRFQTNYVARLVDDLLNNHQKHQEISRKYGIPSDAPLTPR